MHVILLFYFLKATESRVWLAFVHVTKYNKKMEIVSTLKSRLSHNFLLFSHVCTALVFICTEWSHCHLHTFRMCLNCAQNNWIHFPGNVLSIQHNSCGSAATSSSPADSLSLQREQRRFSKTWISSVNQEASQSCGCTSAWKQMKGDNLWIPARLFVVFAEK